MVNRDNIIEYLNKTYSMLPYSIDREANRELRSRLVVNNKEFLILAQFRYPKTAQKRIEIARKGDGFLGYVFGLKLKLSSFPEFK